MYTTVIHPLRVAYQLSPNEYFVLDAIYHLSHKESNGFWCTMSQSELAEKLQFSRQWVNECMQKLLLKGLIKFRKNTSEQLPKSPKQDTAVRTTDEWNEWHDPMNDKYLMFLKSESVELMTGNLSLFEQAKIKYAESIILPKSKKQPVVKDDTPVNSVDTYLSTELTPPVNKPDTILTDTNNNTLSSKEDRPKAYGREDINLMLEALKKVFSLPDFSEPQQWQRIHGSNLVKLCTSLTKDKFFRRLDILAGDAFKRKNCNSLRYIYSQLKSISDEPPTEHVAKIY